MPYAEDSHKKAQSYAASIAPDIVDTISKVRYTWVTSNILTTTMINTEGLLDFALAALYTSITTSLNSFAENYKLCCILLHHSSLVVSRLYVGLASQDKTFTLEEGGYSSRHYTLKPLMRQALKVQDHPHVAWTSIMVGIVPEFDDLYEVFMLFSNYCHVLFNHLSYCSKTGKLPPQLQYRTEYQPYDPSFRARSVYTDECKRLADGLTKLMTLCECVMDNESATSGQTKGTRERLRPRRVNSFVPELETVEE